MPLCQLSPAETITMTEEAQPNARFLLGGAILTLQAAPGAEGSEPVEYVEGATSLESEDWFPYTSAVHTADEWLGYYARVLTAPVGLLPANTTVVSATYPSKRSFKATWAVKDGIVSKLSTPMPVPKKSCKPVDTEYGLLPVTSDQSVSTLAVFLSTIAVTLGFRTSVLVVGDIVDDVDITHPLATLPWLEYAQKNTVPHVMLSAKAGLQSGSRGGCTVWSPEDIHQAACLLLDASAGVKVQQLYKEYVPTKSQTVLLTSVWVLFSLMIAGVVVSYPFPAVGSRMFMGFGIAWGIVFAGTRGLARRFAD